MKQFNFRAFRAISLSTLLFAAVAFQACQDHRLPPQQEELPDQVFYALTDNNVIYELNVRNTATPIRTINITEGLDNGDKLIGIDFRPATGQLYAISQNSRLYHINLNSAVRPGLATAIGAAAFSPGITSTTVGFDFNPMVDRIRLITNTGQNLRLHPETGAIAGTDTQLSGLPSTAVTASAYTNSFSGTTSTMLYNIDPVSDQLYMQGDPNPNDGKLKVVGSLGLDATDVGGFDVAPAKTTGGKDYSIASVLVSGTWELDYVDLATGKLQKLGNLPSGKIIGIAIPSPVAYALSASNELLIFNPWNASAAPITKAISPIPSGVTLEGIDFRPADATLYAFASNGKIYTINILTGAATEKATITPAQTFAADASYGVDFNPFADRLRVVSSTGQNLRINVTDGVTTPDTPLTLSGSSRGVNGAAYTNSHVGLTAGGQTMLFDIDSETDKLYKQDPNPNAGVLVEVGNLSVDISKANGFDIGGVSGKGYGLFTVGGTTGMYEVNLTTGKATLVSSFSAQVKGFTLGFNL